MFFCSLVKTRLQKNIRTRLYAHFVCSVLSEGERVVAIYHFSAKIGSRAKGQSAIASAAYRAAEKLYSHYEGKTFNYTRKQAVVYSKILLPKNAPKEYENREMLWNAVEETEKQANSQLYREFEISLPNECTLDQKKEMVEKFCQHLVLEGMCVDISIHDVKAGQKGKNGKIKQNDNSHAHIMCTLRSINEKGQFMPKRITKYKLDGNGKKIPLLDHYGKQKVEKKTGRKLWEREDVTTNNWGNEEKLEEWRILWQNIANNYLPEGEKIDHRTLLEQNKDKIKELELELELAKEYVVKQEEVAENDRIRAGIARRKRTISQRPGRVIARTFDSERIYSEVGRGATTDKNIDREDNGAETRDYVAELRKQQFDATEQAISRIIAEREETARRQREIEERKKQSRMATKSKQSQRSQSATSNRGYGR